MIDREAQKLAMMVEIWWRLEHVGRYRGGDGGWFGALHRWAYRKRKRAEARLYLAITGESP